MLQFPQSIALAALIAIAPSPVRAQDHKAMAVSSGTVFEKLTMADLERILNEEGYFTTVKKTTVQTKIEGLSVLFLLSEDGESIQFYAAFSRATVDLARVNEWNKRSRFSRAYLDDSNDPVIELDLDLAGGVTRNRILDFIATARISVVAFRRHID